jgi:hypothetical protein
VSVAGVALEPEPEAVLVVKLAVLVNPRAGDIVLVPEVSVERLTVLEGTRSGSVEAEDVVAAAAATTDVVLEDSEVALLAAVAVASVTVLEATRVGETSCVLYVLSVAKSTVVDGTRSGIVDIELEVVCRLASVAACAWTRSGDVVRSPAQSVASST